MENPTRPLSTSWEYRDLEIPLNIEFNLPILQNQNFNWAQLTDSERQCERIVVEHLELAGKEGWQADEPTDFKSLYRSKRITWQQKTAASNAASAALFGLLALPFAKSKGVYESVSIRMKRAKPQ